MSKGLFAGGDGTLDNPYLIEDAFDLDAVRNGLDKHYKLISDINLDVSPFNEGNGWIPLGDSDNPFIGLLDGSGKIISNLKINRSSSSSIGLFGQTRGATIKNLGLINCDVIGNSLVGSIVASLNAGGFLVNCFSTGSVQGHMRENVSTNNTGGLAGDCYNSSVINCYSWCKVSAKINSAGGLIGYCNANARVKNCYSIGEVESAFPKGLIADNKGENKNCFWDINTSKTTESYGGTGLTTQQMQTTQTFIDAGWDKELNDRGEPVWILEDRKYPKLWFETSVKFLIKHQDKICILSNKNNALVYPDIQEPLIQADYEAWGIDALVDFSNSTDRVILQMKDKGVLEDGKMLRCKVNKNDFKINGLEVI